MLKLFPILLSEILVLQARNAQDKRDRAVGFVGNLEKEAGQVHTGGRDVVESSSI